MSQNWLAFHILKIMRNLTLIKSHPNVQLAHLYEHLFVRQIDDYFYTHHLFEPVDYLSRGATYEQAGIVTVDIDFYSDAAWSRRDAVTDLHVDLGENTKNVSQALYQIEAEEPEQLYITDKQQVLDELTKLDSQPWQTLEDYTLFDTKGTRRRFEPIYLTNQPQIKKRTIQTTLTLDDQFLYVHRELAPLFNVVGRYILHATDDRVTAHFGFYSGELSGTAKPLTVSNDMFSIPHKHRPVDVDEVLRLSCDTAHYMLSETVITRIAHELQGITYETSFDSAPDIRRLLLETGVLIGTQGWRQIATPENIRRVLSHTSITVRYGRQKATRQLR